MVRKVTSFNSVTLRILKHQLQNSQEGLADLLNLKKETYESIISEHENMLEMNSDSNPTSYQEQLDNLMTKDLCGLIFSNSMLAYLISLDSDDTLDSCFDSASVINSHSLRGLVGFYLNNLRTIQKIESDP